MSMTTLIRTHIPSLWGPHTLCGTRWCGQSSYWQKYLQRGNQKATCNNSSSTTFWLQEEPGDAVLTFQDGVQDSLFDLCFIYHIGGHLSEDELPWSRFKTIPVVFDDRHAVLKEQITRLSDCVAFDRRLSSLFLSAVCKAVTLTCSLRMIWRTLGFISCSPKDATLLDFSGTLLQTTNFWDLLILVSMKGWATLCG